MQAEPLRFFNRYTGQVETEAIYGDGFLRWAYGNPLGRLALHGIAKRTFFSRWYGWRMNRPSSKSKVLPFIRQFGLDATEFADAPESFRTFNEFFHRKLKPESRPIGPDERSAVFPADGRHLGYPDISTMDGIFVKGEVFDLADLLQDDELAARYKKGSMILSRLCPVDYHRFHFPVAGEASEPRLINGPLFSVNPIALKRDISILTRNKRWVLTIDSGEFGRVVFVVVGATCVGGVEFTFAPCARVEKGAEAGFFKFGGSSTIVLFEEERVRIAEDLRKWSEERLELYARMGDVMARLK